MAVAALLFLSLACGPAPAGLSGTSDAVAADAPRQALDVADSVLSANVEEAGPVEGFWPFLAEDAIFLEKDASVPGVTPGDATAVGLGTCSMPPQSHPPTWPTGARGSAGTDDAGCR